MAERLDSPLRREQIAEAALTIVVEQGLGAVTVRRVG
jgi:DNA-binding transcriptional regulator YbjK